MAFRWLAAWVLALRLGAAAEVSFSGQIAPVLQEKCLACHSAEKARGGYRVHTFEALAAPGKSKETPVVSGRPEASELFKRLTSPDEDERMPQKDAPLSAEQIELFRAWIASGAALDRGGPADPLAALIPRAPHPPAPEKYRRPLPILALAFVPGTGQLAASGHHELLFWSRDGELVRRLGDMPQRIRAAAFDPAGKSVAIAGGQPGCRGEFSVYDLESGRLETTLVQTADEILCAAFSADGRRLACAGTDNAIHVFDWNRRARLALIQQHADWVTALAFNADGSQIASASRDRTARLYESASGTLEVTYTLQTAPLLAVAFLGGDILASGGRGQALHLWSATDGKKKGEIGGFGGDVHAVLAGEGRIFSAGASGQVREHALSDRKLTRSYSGTGAAVFSIAYDEKTRVLACGSYDGTIHLWNTDTGDLTVSFTAAPGWGSNR